MTRRSRCNRLCLRGSYLLEDPDSPAIRLTSEYQGHSAIAQRLSLWNIEIDVLKFGYVSENAIDVNH